MTKIFMSLVLYLPFPLFFCTKMFHLLIDYLLLQAVSTATYIFVKSPKMKNTSILDTNYMSYISKIT